MTEKQQQVLIQKYPKLLVQNSPAQHPFDQRGIEFDSGWDDLFDKLCSNIQRYLDYNKELKQTTLAQGKEKFGSLTTYWDNTDDYIRGLVSMAQTISYGICERCGTNQNVTQNKKGWIKTWCKDCREEHNKEKI